MNLRIYKFPLAHLTDLAIPGYCRALTAQMQDEVPMLWAICDADGEVRTHRFRIYGTGEPLPEPAGAIGQYIATVQDGGGYVWHVFEVQP